MSFWDFLRKYYIIAIFIILEIFSLLLTANTNKRVNAFVLNSSNWAVSGIYKKFFSLSDYLNLRKENNKLLEQNRDLLNELQYYKIDNKEVIRALDINDSSVKYEYISGKIINHFIANSDNYFTLNRGLDDSIESDMGVICPEGIVGVVTNVSNRFSLVLSIFNTKNRLGCKLKNTNYLGTAGWTGDDLHHLTVDQIPNHIKIKVGDTIVTSGIGVYFPEDIFIGTIDTFWRNSNDNFYTIKIHTGLNAGNLNKVYVIKNYFANEQKTLESEVKAN